MELTDFTARIGDPSGQDKTRPMLSKEQVDAYAQGVLGEMKKILLPDALEIRPNSEWLEALGTQGVLELASEGTSIPELGAELALSPDTVRTHLKNIYAKLGVHNRTGAVTRAMRLGLINC